MVKGQCFMLYVDGEGGGCGSVEGVVEGEGGVECEGDGVGERRMVFSERFLVLLNVKVKVVFWELNVDGEVYCDAAGVAEVSREADGEC